MSEINEIDEMTPPDQPEQAVQAEQVNQSEQPEQAVQPVQAEQADLPNLPNPTPEQEGLEPQEEPQPGPKRRIRSRTLFTAAVVVGVLGGVGTGYAIQASRPATPLPSLTETQPKYAPPAVYQGIAPAMLPSSQDDATLTDGDLTKLLLPVPKGASTDDSGWLDQAIQVEDDADTCDNDPGQCFSNDFLDGVEAIADTSWVQNGYYVEIRIFRFAPGQSSSAQNWLINNQSDTGAFTVPNGIDANGYEYRDSNDEYDDTAFAVHGDLGVKFWVTSPTKAPNPSIIDKVITEQMGRL